MILPSWRALAAGSPLLFLALTEETPDQSSRLAGRITARELLELFTRDRSLCRAGIPARSRDPPP